MLARLNAHPRDNRIKFEEASHVYTIDDGGETYTSVTTFIKPLFDEFDADKVIANMMKSKKWPESKYFGKTADEIKEAWASAGANAATLGTKMHADIEAFYNEEPVLNDSPEFQYFLQFHRELKTLKPYRTEWTVFDEELRIAGSIDMVYVRDDGDLVIYDWKRVKNIEKSSRFAGVGKHEAIAHLPDTNYWHYALQLNLYKYVLEKNYGVKVVGLCLVCLHPDKAKAEIVHVCDLQSEIRELFKK